MSSISIAGPLFKFGEMEPNVTGRIINDVSLPLVQQCTINDIQFTPGAAVHNK